MQIQISPVDFQFLFSIFYIPPIIQSEYVAERFQFKFIMYFTPWPLPPSWVFQYYCLAPSMFPFIFFLLMTSSLVLLILTIIETFLGPIVFYLFGKPRMKKTIHSAPVREFSISVHCSILLHFVLNCQQDFCIFMIQWHKLVSVKLVRWYSLIFQ